MARIFTATLTAVREANTTQYAANEEWSNDDTAPTAYTIAETAHMNGQIVDAVISSTNDPATPLEAELWLFDASTSLVNDNSAWALSDADALKLIGIIPFTLVTSVAGSGTNSVAHVIGIDTAFDCVAKSAGIYVRIKVKNAYVPASAETLTARFKIRREAG